LSVRGVRLTIKEGKRGSGYEAMFNAREIARVEDQGDGRRWGCIVVTTSGEVLRVGESYQYVNEQWLQVVQ